MCYLFFVIFFILFVMGCYLLFVLCNGLFFAMCNGFFLCNGLLFVMCMGNMFLFAICFYLQWRSVDILYKLAVPNKGEYNRVLTTYNGQSKSPWKY